MSILWASAPPEEAPQAAQRIFERYEYQKHLFHPEPFVPPPSSTTAEQPSSGGHSPTVEEAERRHPSGERWSREGWRDQDKAEIERWFGRPDERGGPEARLREREIEWEQRRGGGSLGGLLEILVWIALFVLLGTVIASIIRNRRAPEATIEPTVEADTSAPAAALEKPRTEAERLADEGRYEEAIHHLLLETIEALAQARKGGLPDSWTSREIERGLPMPDPAREPFSHLVGAVESSLFGGRPVGEAEWLACQERFHLFETAYRGGRA